MRRIPLILVALSLIASLAASGDRQEVSRRLNEIAGQGLNPDPGKGRSFSLPPGVEGFSELSAGEAVSIALWNSPALEVALTDLGLARADLLAAGVLINPTFDVLFGIGLKPWEFLFKMPLQAFWQRPRRIAAAKLNLQTVAQHLVQGGLGLVRDTRIAHAELVSAQRQAELSLQTNSLLEEIADLTDRRRAAGDISDLEARLVRVEAINSATITAQTNLDLELARERVLTLLGASGQIPELKAVRRSIDLEPPPGEEGLLRTALESRPDLKAAGLAVEVAGENAGWERSRVFDLLAVDLSVKEVGTSGFKAGPGLSVALPLFDRNQGGISRAEAELQRTLALHAELAFRVQREVRTARIRVLQAQKQLEIVRSELLPILKETLDLAENAYDNGNVSYLDLQLAQKPVVDALRSEESVILEFHRAKAELEWSVGGVL